MRIISKNKKNAEFIVTFCSLVVVCIMIVGAFIFNIETYAKIVCCALILVYLIGTFLITFDIIKEKRTFKKMLKNEFGKLEGLIGKENISSEVGILNERLENEIISNCIEKVEMIKQEGDNFFANIYLKDGHIIYPVSIPVNDFASIIDDCMKREIVEYSVDMIQIKENNDSKTYSLRVEGGDDFVKEYTELDKRILLNTIRVKN